MNVHGATAVTLHERDLGFLPRTKKKKSECKFQVLCSLEVKKERSAGYKTLCEALCVVKRDLPAEKTKCTHCLSQVQCSGVAAPYNMQSAFHDSHLENESMKYHLHYPTRKRDNNLPNRNQFLKVCVEIQFIFFNAADGNTPNLHFIFSPLHFKNSL